MFKGGQQLGRGFQGWVISPAIPCKLEDLERKNYLKSMASKIFKEDIDGEIAYDNETNPFLLEILREIDPNHEDFIYATELPTHFFKISELDEETKYDLRFFKQYFKLFGKKLKTTKDLKFYNMPKVIIIENDNYLSKDEYDNVLRKVKKLHRAGIIHNDLKMQNIVRTDKGLRILDFGIAQTVHEFSYKDLQRWDEIVSKDLRHLEALID